MRFLLSILFAILALVVVVRAAAPTRPLFPSSYSSVEHVRLSQPGQPDQVATSNIFYLQGAQGNLTACFSNGGSSYVADFDQQVIYYLDYYKQCQYTCPMQSDTVCDSTLNGDSLCTYDYLHDSTFAGVSVVNGVKTNEFAWNDMLGSIQMADHQLFVQQGSNVPVRMQATFTPFGQLAGNVTLDYESFIPGPPPASAFNFTGAEYCQEADDCQSSASFHRNLIAKILMVHRVMRR